MKNTKKTTSQSLTGYAYLREMEKKLGAEEVDRVENYGIFDVLLEDIVCHDNMAVPLSREILDETWSNAVENTDSRQAHFKKMDATIPTKTAGGQS